VTFTIRRSTLVVVLVSAMIAVGFVVISQRANAASSTPVVYVATGENYPDALGAASAAAVQGGPVLLVQRDSIPQVTKDELVRLSPDVIVVAGGTAVVSDSVFNQLGAYASSVVRAAGPNRYSTAVEVSKSAFPVTGGGNATLEARVATLEALLAGVVRNGDTLLFDGMNLQVVNGEGQTASSNGLGNVIIGYNEVNPSAARASRVGSHYLIVGEKHAYTAFAGIVSGRNNTASGNYASVTGGDYNTASGLAASVTGGQNNTAESGRSTISGGVLNTTLGAYSSVAGGNSNIASGGYASVSGGNSNIASGEYASVTGGYFNEAHGNYDTVIGGDDRACSHPGAVTCGEGYWYADDA
jgi:hypothetical protein